MQKSDICVLGASNIDLISYVPRLPLMGETLHGTKFQMGFGGKGANQAVMAARLGAQVSLISKLGKDIFGENTLKNLQTVGVNTDFVLFSRSAFTGVAPIFVDNNGNNSIVIITGANDELTEEEIQSASEVIRRSKVFVCQLEIPSAISLLALKIAQEAGVFTILNPAPARIDLPEEIYTYCNLICPNESEIELLTGIKVTSLEDCEQAAQVLVERGAGSALVTLGERGAMFVSATERFYKPAHKVSAIDTTGAGDAFVGSLSFYISKGIAMPEAVQRANIVASISVQHAGTQSSFPFPEDLPPDLLVK
jgi:ribokinase